MTKIIKREIVPGTVGVIEGRNRKVMLWIERTIDEMGIEHYQTCKSVIYRELPPNPKLLNGSQQDILLKLN